MCELVTNVTFFVNRIIDHPIGCVGVTLPAYIKKNKAVIGLEREPNHSKVTIEGLYRAETTFKTNVCLNKLVESNAEDGKTTAELVRRSLCHNPNTLHINLHETQFSYIQVVRMYCHSYRCQKCSNSLWKYAYHLHRHERMYTVSVCRVYPGGVYHSTPSVFERLDDENIQVSKSLRYYPYRVTFEFVESWLYCRSYG